MLASCTRICHLTIKVQLQDSKSICAHIIATITIITSLQFQEKQNSEHKEEQFVDMNTILLKFQQKQSLPINYYLHKRKQHI